MTTAALLVGHGRRRHGKQGAARGSGRGSVGVKGVIHDLLGRFITIQQCWDAWQQGAELGSCMNATQTKQRTSGGCESSTFGRHKTVYSGHIRAKTPKAKLLVS